MVNHPNRKAQRVVITVDTGSQFTNDQDRKRAARAAEEVLDYNKVDYAAAQAAYDADMAGTDDLGRTEMSKLGLIWEDAEAAANNALTDGWTDTNGAYCTIRAA